MKDLFNWILRLLVKLALFLFYRKIVLLGKNNIPSKKAVIIVCNHQNALIDPLLIATQTHLKPHFLTRAAAFKNPIANTLLRFIRMIPVYRVRDGKENMEKNNETFDLSVSILSKLGSVLIFAEGGHSHERSLRSLKKGFTRIAFQTLEQRPNLDLVILPIGINYTNHTQSGGKVTLMVGNSISVKPYLYQHEALMAATSRALDPLVTQLPLNKYEHTLHHLINQKIDLSNPVAVRKAIPSLDTDNQLTLPTAPLPSKIFFRWIHWPLQLIWKKVKPSIQDPVFQATFKFIIGLVGYPILLLLVPSFFSLIGLPIVGYCWILLSMLSVLSNQSRQE
ncbi:1-acyl-sn-glycerol-3-phosphate acyltransferase [Mongoliitalea lutea]|uniref:Phospholipid/glycerol acyltransferase domain-containing protein n=1 Tax=Mongoliitalea lutea TaxID=849756 RepID=A0A8J3CUZ6_9BACT|nr:1-acyl-sn-glycerol-3-phosphate acyltransferase [Mongoliitalea lutea]GHB23676.1 hypothetical protein GCM10008106_00290 [Mongoliitalea lutea]